MARWKAHVDFLLTVIELLFLYLTIDALQGKMCQNSLLLGRGGSVWATISGKRGRPWGIFFLVFTKLHIFCYLTVQTAPCYVQSFWHNTGVWQTDGIAVAITALTMRALRRAEITVDLHMLTMLWRLLSLTAVLGLCKLS